MKKAKNEKKKIQRDKKYIHRKKMTLLITRE